ncbi:MAG: MFS transporter [Chloroflexota bacterium]|nr:MFS transporter [Chloroflexota bacterium]
MSISQPASPQAPSIWDPGHITLTIGTILAVTIVALQGIALATMAPVLADDIGGRDLYGWIFTAFILPQIVGTVLGGQEVDRRSPASVFLAHLVLFAIGCLVAGAAPSIYVFFLGRALQGFGAGGMFSCIYAVISVAYEDRLRPAILAVVSSAFIIPSLIGPTLAGFISEQYSWRYVFFGFLPVLAIIAPLTLPAYRRVRREPSTVRKADGVNRLALATLLAVGTGLFLSGLEFRPWPLALIASVIGLSVLVPMLRRLLPEGAFSARPMLPGVISARGLLFGGFIVVETYMIFALTEFGDVSATRAGVVLTGGSLTWTAGSMMQARWDRIAGSAVRPFRLAVGIGLTVISTGVILGCVVIFRDIWLEVAFAAWLITGLGIGLAYPTASSMAFAYAPSGQEGMVSSSTLLADLFAFSTGVGLAGVILTLGESLDFGTVPSTAAAIGVGVTMLTLALMCALRLYGAREIVTRSVSKAITSS